MAEPAAIDVRGVRVTYPARRRQPAREALRGCDLEVAGGAMVAMLGPNGSGKSTLLKVIAAALPADEGTVEVVGQRAPAARRAVLGVVFQSTALDRQLTVTENLRCQAALFGLSGAEAAARIDRELERANLADRRNDRISTLSLGLARRVDLCRAVLHEPRVLLLDEPTVGLDPVAREAFLTSLDARRDEGLAILMTTHLVDEAERCDRVVMLHRGEVIADDTPAALRARAGRAVVTARVNGDAEPPEAALSWRRGARGWTARVVDEVSVESIAAHLAEANVAFSIAPPTLADVFEDLAGEDLDTDEAGGAT